MKNRYKDSYYDADSNIDANSYTRSEEGTKSITFMNRVYLWMTGALLLSALSAFIVLRDEQLLMAARKSFTLIFIIELGFVFAISGFINKIQSGVAGALFGVYAVLSGVTLGVIVSFYAQDAILPAFIASAGTFGVTSIFGYVTKKDLSSVGGFCMMALIGAIIATLVNVFFFKSSALYWITTYVLVFVFIGLTAWDTQKLKKLAQMNPDSSEISKKTAITGALSLYLDFINLFILFLRIFSGGRR